MPLIFLSHSNRDNKVVAEIMPILSGLGFEILLDLDKDAEFFPGIDYERALYREISRCHVVILFLTKNWLDSKWCFAEMAQARALGKMILPLVFESLEQTFVPTEIPLIDLTDRSKKVLDRLKGVLAGIGAASSPDQAVKVVQTSDLSQASTTPSTNDSSTGAAYDRDTPEHWLNQVAVERQLLHGGEPMVLLSFATEDQSWIDDVRAFLDPRIEQLRDPNGRLYHAWDFSDVRRGTVPGDEFPTIVAERMWNCRVRAAYFE